MLFRSLCTGPMDAATCTTDTLGHLFRLRHNTEVICAWSLKVYRHSVHTIAMALRLISPITMKYSNSCDTGTQSTSAQSSTAISPRHALNLSQSTWTTEVKYIFCSCILMLKQIFTSLPIFQCPLNSLPVFYIPHPPWRVFSTEDDWVSV